jgi:hypothetical protein
MRNFLQSKISEDQQIQSKNTEKNTVLFQEMVRLGQENEKYSHKVHGMHNEYEAKLTQLEGRLAHAEQSNMMFDKKGDSNTTILSEMLEKMENRLLMVDQQVMSLKN